MTCPDSVADGPWRGVRVEGVADAVRLNQRRSEKWREKERCRVSLLSFEDDKDELRRRVRAGMRHYGINPIVGFGRAAGADIAHLRAFQFGEAAASGESVPVEALVRMPPDENLYSAGEVERVG